MVFYINFIDEFICFANFRVGLVGGVRGGVLWREERFCCGYGAIRFLCKSLGWHFSQAGVGVGRTISKTGAVILHRAKVNLNMGNF